MTPAELKKLFEQQFAAAGIETPAVDAALLISETAGISQLDMILYPERELLPETETLLRQLAQRRCRREPLQYITGKAYFRDLMLSVNPAVLIPRPETELLVDFVLKALPPNGHACELGTGSGAIALSIGFERPDSRVTASEISPAAFAIAEANRKKYGLNNVSLVRGDLFSPFDPEVKFDLLAANLPYIPESVRDALPRNVRDYEPSLALFADHEGMALIERALVDAPRYLKPGAPLFFEMGEEQGAALAAFARSRNCYSGIQVLQDQYGVDRFLTCIFTPDTCKDSRGTV